MNQISIGTGPGSRLLHLDLDRLVLTRLQVTASSGGGKSITLRTIIESAYGHTQIIILDDEGEFSTLRPKYDFIILGQDGDVGFNPHHGAAYALAFLESGKDVVVDLSELDLGQKQVFVRDFLNAMVDAPRRLWHDVLLVLDEAHEYAPEKNPAVSSKAVARMSSKGRKRGFALLLATQRPSKLSKDVSAECQNKIIGVQNLPDDRRRAADELGFHSKEEAMVLRDVEPGEFFACGPALRLGSDRLRGVEKISIRMSKTEPPPRGSKRKRVPAAGAKLKAELKKLAGLPKEAEQIIRDMAEANKKITELHRQLAASERAQPQAFQEDNVSPAQVQQVVKAALEAQSVNHHKFVEDFVVELLKTANGTVEALVRVLKEARHRPKFDMAALKLTTATIRPSGKPIKVPEPRNIGKRAAGMEHPHGYKSDAFLQREAQHDVALQGGIKLVLAERKIITFLYHHHSGAGNNRVAVATGYAVNGGGFKNAVGRLAGLKIIHRQGDLLMLTGDVEVSQWLTDDKFTVTAWLNKLPKCERTILGHLIANAPQAFTREELAEATGYDLDGGGFKNALGKLGTLCLIDRSDNVIRLSEEARQK